MIRLLLGVATALMLAACGYAPAPAPMEVTAAGQAGHPNHDYGQLRPY